MLLAAQKAGTQGDHTVRRYVGLLALLHNKHMWTLNSRLVVIRGIIFASKMLLRP